MVDRPDRRVMGHTVLVSDALSPAGLAALMATPGLDVDYAPGLT